MLQLERSASRRGEEAAQHALEHVALQDRQLGLLADRLQVRSVLPCEIQEAYDVAELTHIPHDTPGDREL